MHVAHHVSLVEASTLFPKRTRMPGSSSRAYSLSINFLSGCRFTRPPQHCRSNRFKRASPSKIFRSSAHVQCTTYAIHALALRSYSFSKCLRVCTRVETINPRTNDDTIGEVSNPNTSIGDVVSPTRSVPNPPLKTADYLRHRVIAS
jgi:hypothetical protein